jgi:hypothetical protein
MNARKLKKSLLFPLFVCSLVVFAAASVRAQLSVGQARKAFTEAPGFKLKSSSVRVKSVSSTSKTAGEASAEIKSVFRLEQDKQGNWRVVEVRTGEDIWESVNFIANALNAKIESGVCTSLDPPAKGKLATDPSVKRARCLLASLLGVDLPSDAIRIQEVSPAPIPLASQGSATVVAWIRVDARLLKDKGWRVTELRTGNHDWATVDSVIAEVNQQKRDRANAELELMAQALERFRQERGFYVVSDSQAVAMDHLSPRYLARVIRVDPWQQPYKYQGDRDHFTLRSAGPDRKADTPDDLVSSK